MEWNGTRMNKTMNRRLIELNNKIALRTPGYYVKANDTGRFVWSLIGPDGKVHYTRDSLEAIEAVALR